MVTLRPSNFATDFGTRNRRSRSNEETNLYFVLNATLTNATFASWFCDDVDVSAETVTITGVEGMIFALPSCFAQGTNVKTFTADYIGIEDFRFFPQSLEEIDLSYTNFVPNQAAAMDSLSGFQIDGSVLWNKVWPQLPNITSFTVINSYLVGAVPPLLPPKLNTLVITGCRLSGPIPSGMLLNHPLPPVPTTFELSLSENEINGTLPEDLFNGFTANGWDAIKIDFANNKLSGPIPQNFLWSLANAAIPNLFQLLLTNNEFYGLPTQSIFPKNMVALNARVKLDISDNTFEGGIPSALFANLTQFSGFEFTADHCGFSGNLPARLFSSDWTKGPTLSPFVISLAENFFNGPIPDSLLVGGLKSNATFKDLNLDLSHNALEGSLPEGLFYTSTGATQPDSRRDDRTGRATPQSANAADQARTKADQAQFEDPVVISISFDLAIVIQASHNQLTALPSNLFQHSEMPSLSTFFFALNDNPIIGGIPVSLFEPIPSNIDAEYKIQFSNTQITGSPPPHCWTSGSTHWDQSNSDLSGTIPLAWQECKWYYMSFDSNPRFASTIPAALFNMTNIETFSASNTPLTGILPPLGSSLKVLRLRNTSLDFCDARSSASIESYGYECLINGSNACDCVSHYTRCGAECSAVTPAPFNPPLPFITPISSIPISSAKPCSKKSRPSPEFICIDGAWTSNSTNTTKLVVPPGAGTVVVTGNLTSTTVVIQGIGSTINITGSVTNLTTITVELSSAEVDALGKGKVLQILLNTGNGTGSVQLEQVGVNSRVTSGCKKVKAEKVVLNEGQTLAAYLSVDSSGCNRWWTILVSVVVSAIVLALIVLVLLAVFCKPFREKVRPYSKARRPASPST